MVGSAVVGESDGEVVGSEVVGEIDGEVVGKITSGTKSPTTGKAIGLAYVPLSASAAGTPITVDCRGRMRGAVVADTPFYSRPKGD